MSDASSPLPPPTEGIVLPRTTGKQRERHWDARVQLHWALQLVATIGHELLTPTADDSHTSLTWEPHRHAFCSGWTAATDEVPAEDAEERRPRLRVDLELEPLRLRIERARPQAGNRREGQDGGSDDAEPLSLALRGYPLEVAFSWLRERLEELDLPLPETAALSEYDDIPRHAVIDEAAPLDPDEEGLRELLARYHNAHLILTELLGARPEATPIRIWPHHMDAAALLVYGDDPEQDPVIGLGMTPGDSYRTEPYWYVNPYGSGWATPESLPDLPEGAYWEREAFFGAVLSTKTIGEQKRPSEQRAMLERFVRTSIRLQRQMMGLPDEASGG